VLGDHRVDSHRPRHRRGSRFRQLGRIFRAEVPPKTGLEGGPRQFHWVLITVYRANADPTLLERDAAVRIAKRPMSDGDRERAAQSLVDAAPLFVAVPWS